MVPMSLREGLGSPLLCPYLDSRDLWEEEEIFLEITKMKKDLRLYLSKF